MRIAIIGCGVMGSAFAKHFARKHTLALCDHHHKYAAALAKEIGGKAFEKAKDEITACLVDRTLPQLQHQLSDLFFEQNYCISQ